MREKQEKAKLEKQKRIEQVKQELKENPVEKSQDREVVCSMISFIFLLKSSNLFLRDLFYLSDLVVVLLQIFVNFFRSV
jgi:hypothetical protein